MTAPTSGGTYREDWKFINGGGTTILVSNSSTVWVSIKVADSSGSDKADFVAETYPDGTSVPAGQTFTKSWTIRNSGTTTWNSNYKLRWLSGASLSNHADVPVNGTVSPGSNYTFSVPMTAPNATGTYREDWKLTNASGLTIPVSGSNAIWVSVRVNTGGQSSITGSVMSSSGGPVAGANVQLGNISVQSDSQGTYSISSIAAGDYTAAVSKTGYATFAGPVSIPTNTQAHKDFTLQPNASTTNITISSVTTRYPGRSYFLNGITHNVTFTVNVNWGSHPPSSVSFITPRATYVVLTSSTTVSRTFDMGSEYGTCGNLRVRANGADGATSSEALANFVVMSQAPYLPASLTRLVDAGDSFSYELPSDVTFKIPILSNTIEGFLIPDKIPFFGSKGFAVSFDATAAASITNDGRLKYTADFGIGRSNTNTDLLKFVKGQIGGQDFSLTSSFGASANFSDTSCRWSNWSGVAGVNGDAFSTGSITFHKLFTWSILMGALG
jgi:hypothetical protein